MIQLNLNKALQLDGGYVSRLYWSLVREIFDEYCLDMEIFGNFRHWILCVACNSAARSEFFSEVSDMASLLSVSWVKCLRVWFAYHLKCILLLAELSDESCA